MSAVSNCVQKLTKGLFPLGMIKIVEEKRNIEDSQNLFIFLLRCATAAAGASFQTPLYQVPIIPNFTLKRHNSSIPQDS